MSSNDKQLLITTALDATWETDRPFTLLGRWCLANADSLDERQYQIAPYHWDDRKLLASDYKKLSALYEEVLLDITASLNHIHGVEHSSRYWRILLGPWLGSLVQILYDRWTSVESIVKEQSNYETTVINYNLNELIPNDMTEFGVMLTEDKWNHYIYSVIIKEFPSILIREQRDSLAQQDTREQHSALTLDRKNRILLLIEKLMFPLTRSGDVFLIATYLPRWKQIMLQLSLGQIPAIHCTKEDRRKYKLRSELRDWEIKPREGKTDIRSPFERWLRAFIPQQIPTAYLEGYKSQLARVNKANWPAAPKIIWTSGLYQSHDYFKLWAAEKIEQGAKLIIGQHGGNFGMAAWNTSEDHQVAISDAYLSWGWRDQSRPEIIPVGQLKSLPVVPKEDTESDRVMLVTAELPRYSYWMMSSFVAGQWLDYLKDQFALIDLLPDGFRESFVVRLKLAGSAWQAKNGWNSLGRWRNRFPDIEIDIGANNFHKEIMKCKLVITTYNAATYLESMAMNIPTLIFWNPEHWELREDAKEYMMELEKAGIFHTTPESAAKHLENIWNDVSAWWESNSVQSAKDNFCREYSALNKNMSGQIKGIIEGLL